MKGEHPELLDHLHWLGHDSFRIDQPIVIYLDPWRLPPGSPPALPTEDPESHRGALPSLANHHRQGNPDGAPGREGPGQKLTQEKGGQGRGEEALYKPTDSPRQSTPSRDDSHSGEVRKGGKEEEEPLDGAGPGPELRELFRTLESLVQEGPNAGAAHRKDRCGGG